MVDHVAWGLLLSSLAGGSTTIGGAIGVGCCVLRMVVFWKFTTDCCLAIVVTGIRTEYDH